MNIGYSPACADGGTSDFLSLFIAQGQHLKPVLKELPMSQWKLTSGRPLGCVFESKGYTQDEAQMTLAIAPTRSHGLNDLNITAFIQPQADGEVNDKVFAMQKPKQIRGTLRFDGTSYRTDAWDKALEKQWPWVLIP